MFLYGWYLCIFFIGERCTRNWEKSRAIFTTFFTPPVKVTCTFLFLFSPFTWTNNQVESVTDTFKSVVFVSTCAHVWNNTEIHWMRYGHIKIFFEVLVQYNFNKKSDKYPSLSLDGYKQWTEAPLYSSIVLFMYCLSPTSTFVSISMPHMVDSSE